jgi:hippurate hydrolase
MIGQPTEESQGARHARRRFVHTVPQAGLLRGAHCAADLPAGQVGVTEGCARQRQLGGYPRPRRGRPRRLAAQDQDRSSWRRRSSSPQTIVSRETEPTQPAVVTVGSIHGGTNTTSFPTKSACN